MSHSTDETGELEPKRTRRREGDTRRIGPREGTMSGPLTPGNISTKQAWIAKLASTYPNQAIRSVAHHMDLEWLVRAHRGFWIPKRKTAKDRFSRWLRRWRHLSIAEQVEGLSQRMRGHFNYFGVRGNSRSLGHFAHEVRCVWLKWLSRRSQRARMTWTVFRRLLNRYPLPSSRLRPKKRQLRLANLYS